MRYDRTVGSINIKIDTKRMDANLKRAQDELDAQVLKDMELYMPFRQGDLREKTRIMEPGLIVTDTPYAHYQYEGELYLTKDGRSWAGEGEKKYPTGERLKYHAPGTGDHWFEDAKRDHFGEWLDLARREAGKG